MHERVIHLVFTQEFLRATVRNTKDVHRGEQ